MRRLTAGELISELKKFDKDKLVYMDDELADDFISIESVSVIKKPRRNPDHVGHIYLGPTLE